MTITSEHLGNLRGLIKFASPLPWKWATSNSTARLSSASGKDGDVVSAFRATDGVPCVNVSSDNMNLIASAVNYLPELLAHIEAQAARIAELENDEVRQRLANAEHQLYMKDLAIQNVKASRRAQFRKRQEAEKELAALMNENKIYQVSADNGMVMLWADVTQAEYKDSYRKKRFVYTTPPAPAIPDGCTWKWDEHDYHWQAACGGTWLFCDGGPAENEVNFCQKCGGRVIIVEDSEE